FSNMMTAIASAAPHRYTETHTEQPGYVCGLIVARRDNPGIYI
ncbi:8490_t:CDS:1, partial [Paraglomus occultum]